MKNGRALVAVSAVGMLPIVKIVDEFAKSLGLENVSITSERGRGRVVALWHCSDDIALEIKYLISRLPAEISRSCEVFVTLNAAELRATDFGDQL